MEALCIISAFAAGWFIRAESERILKIRRANAKKKAECKARPAKREKAWSAIKRIDPDKKLVAVR